MSRSIMRFQLFSRRFRTFDFSGSIDRIDYHVLFFLWCRKIGIRISNCFFHKNNLHILVFDSLDKKKINPKLFTALRRERRSWATSGVIVEEMTLNTNKAVNYE